MKKKTIDKNLTIELPFNVNLIRKYTSFFEDFSKHIKDLYPSLNKDQINRITEKYIDKKCKSDPIWMSLNLGVIRVEQIIDEHVAEQKDSKSANKQISTKEKMPACRRKSQIGSPITPNTSNMPAGREVTENDCAVIRNTRSSAKRQRVDEDARNDPPKKKKKTQKKVTILLKDLTLEELMQFTNFESYVKADIEAQNPGKSAKYLRSLDKYLQRHYDRFVSCPHWPHVLKFNDPSIRTMEDFIRMKNQACKQDKKKQNVIQSSPDMFPSSGESKGEDKKEEKDLTPAQNKSLDVENNNLKSLADGKTQETPSTTPTNSEHPSAIVNEIVEPPNVVFIDPSNTTMFTQNFTTVSQDPLELTTASENLSEMNVSSVPSESSNETTVILNPSSQLADENEQPINNSDIQLGNGSDSLAVSKNIKEDPDECDDNTTFESPEVIFVPNEKTEIIEILDKTSSPELLKEMMGTNMDFSSSTVGTTPMPFTTIHDLLPLSPVKEPIQAPCETTASQTSSTSIDKNVELHKAAPIMNDNGGVSSDNENHTGRNIDTNSTKAASSTSGGELNISNNNVENQRIEITREDQSESYAKTIIFAIPPDLKQRLTHIRNQSNVSDTTNSFHPEKVIKEEYSVDIKVEPFDENDVVVNSYSINHNVKVLQTLNNLVQDKENHNSNNTQIHDLDPIKMDHIRAAVNEAPNDPENNEMIEAENCIGTFRQALSQREAVISRNVEFKMEPPDEESCDRNKQNQPVCETEGNVLDIAEHDNSMNPNLSQNNLAMILTTELNIDRSPDENNVAFVSALPSQELDTLPVSTSSLGNIDRTHTADNVSPQIENVLGFPCGETEKSNDKPNCSNSTATVALESPLAALATITQEENTGPDEQINNNKNEGTAKSYHLTPKNIDIKTFRYATNVENIFRKRIQEKYAGPKQEEYLSVLEKLIVSYYNKVFCELESWPPGIQIRDVRIRLPRIDERHITKKATDWCAINFDSRKCELDIVREVLAKKG